MTPQGDLTTGCNRRRLRGRRLPGNTLGRSMAPGRGDSSAHRDVPKLILQIVWTIAALLVGALIVLNLLLVK